MSASCKVALPPRGHGFHPLPKTPGGAVIISKESDEWLALTRRRENFLRYLQLREHGQSAERRYDGTYGAWWILAQLGGLGATW